MTVRWTILSCPRYSPDLVPSDLHLFGPLQDALEDVVLWMMGAETERERERETKNLWTSSGPRTTG